METGRRDAGRRAQAPVQELLLDATQACLNGHWDRAATVVDDALRSYPDEGELLHLKGLSLARAGNREHAVCVLRRAVLLRPGSAQIHYNLAVTCVELARDDEAMVHYRHCLRLDPKHRDALWNFGEMLRLREHFAEATRCFEALESQNAHYPWLDYRLGCARSGGGNTTGAVRSFEHELARVDPNSPAESGPYPASALVHWEYAHLLLRAGDFDRGFVSYEHRFQAGDRTGVRCAAFESKRWQGEPLAGKALLIHGEQGLGDQIMFAALVPQILGEIGLSGRLVLAVAPPLVRLFALAWPDAAVVPHTPQAPASGPWLDNVDFESPICSLARWRMPADDGLRAQPPYLRAPEHERAVMRARLAALAPRSCRSLKVGLMWGSNPAPWDAKAAARATRKSIPLAELAPLAGLPGITFVSLQNHDLAFDAAHAAFDIVDCHEVLSDMACTAALIAEMDVVVSVDTSVAHLAAAMGTAPWLLLMERADWRWGVDEGACAWYRELTQLRQLEQGDWKPVVADLRERLALRRSHLSRVSWP
jgi:Flp pilus assembly protein TadD